MRKLKDSLSISFFVMLLMVGAASLGTAQAAAVRVEIGGAVGNPPGMFFSALQPYGNWIWAAGFGWAWQPTDIDVGWRPYTLGHWAYTDDGWTWVSNWQWGWACFHYGRWAFDTDYGWIWVPGMDWGPAWVVWRTGGDWIGWAPLPPGAEWRGDRLEHGDWDRIPKWQFSFVRDHDFLSDRLRDHIEGPEFNVRIFDRTNPRVDYRREDGHIVDRNDMHDHLATVLGRPIERRPLAEVRSLDRLREGRREGDHEVRVFRPNRQALMRNRGDEQLYRQFIVPPEIRSRQQREQEQLRQRQDRERQALQERQRRELEQGEHGRPGRGRGLPGQEFDRNQILRQQQAERNAFEQQMQREQRLMQEAHQRESRRYGAPGAEHSFQRAERGPERGPERGEQTEREGGRGRGRH
ncbi:MAG: DUF6600 domain-containing protein [Acidobacteriota bacterium]